MVTNCVNCGVPIEKDKDKCPYCGTPYDVGGFESSIANYTGTITIGKKTYNVYLGEFELRSIKSEPYRDIHGILHETAFRNKRKFTLIEI